MKRETVYSASIIVSYSLSHPYTNLPSPPSLPSSLPLYAPEWFSYRAHAEHNVKVVAHSLYQVSKHGVWSICDTILLGICTQCLTYLNRQIYIYREREREKEIEREFNTGLSIKIFLTNDTQPYLSKFDTLKKFIR